MTLDELDTCVRSEGRGNPNTLNDYHGQSYTHITGKNCPSESSMNNGVGIL